MIVGLFGILGNITSILVLAKLQTHNLFDSLLIALTIVDIIFIFFTIVDYAMARGLSSPMNYWCAIFEGQEIREG